MVDIFILVYICTLSHCTCTCTCTPYGTCMYMSRYKYMNMCAQACGLVHNMTRRYKACVLSIEIIASNRQEQSCSKEPSPS